MKDGKSPGLAKGWAELGGRQAVGKPQDPKAVYTPRVNGIEEPVQPDPGLEFDDTTDDLPVSVDVKLRRNSRD